MKSTVCLGFVVVCCYVWPACRIDRPAQLNKLTPSVKSGGKLLANTHIDEPKEQKELKLEKKTEQIVTGWCFTPGATSPPPPPGAPDVERGTVNLLKTMEFLRLPLRSSGSPNFTVRIKSGRSGVRIPLAPGFVPGRLQNWHSSGYPARRLALEGQRWDWSVRCQYTVTR